MPAPERLVVYRARAGYELRPMRLPYADGPVMVLVPRVSASSGKAELEPYTPDSHERLFLDLAAVAPEADAILDFANRFGALGLRYRRNRDPQLGYVELLSEWGEEIDRLKQALTLWKALHDGDQEMLRTLIRWDRNGAGVVYDTHADTPFGAMSEGTRRTSAIIASKRQGGGVHPELLAAMAPGDAVAPARALPHATSQ